MESIAASPVAREHVGGAVGKAIRSGLAAGAFICAGLMSVATSAQAADNSINGGCMIGAIAGGLLGNQVGGGNGRKVATAAGAVLGCKSGQDVQANSEYRQQRPAGYDNNRGYDNRRYSEPSRPRYSQQAQPRYEEPARDSGQYYGQQAMSANPMQSYMPHTFGQIEGRESPSQSLGTQGRMAMDKALAEAESRMRDNVRAQQIYAQLYDQRNGAISQSMNPEAEALMGGSSLRNNAAQLDQRLNRAGQDRARANANFGSAGMRVANLAEYEAAQGYDVRPYADRIMGILNAPMSAPVTGINSTTQQRVTFATPSAMR